MSVPLSKVWSRISCLLLLWCFSGFLWASSPQISSQDLEVLDEAYRDIPKFLLAVYDEKFGGFWESTEDKRKQVGKPRLESHCRAISAMSKLIDLKDLPPKLRQVWVDYICSFQGEDGWFDDPQEKRLKKNRLGRAMGYAIKTLGLLGAKPKRALPMEREDQSNDRDLAHLSSKASVRAWIKEVSKKNKSWKAGSSVNGQSNVIFALPEARREEVVAWIKEVLAEEQSEDGFWWRGYPYNRLSGTFKLTSFYKRAELPVPRADKIYQNTLKTMREEKAFTGCFVRNPLHVLMVIRPQVESLMTADDLKDIVDITIKNVRQFKTEDGGFAMHLKKKHGTTDGLSQAMKGRDGARLFAGLEPKPFPSGDQWLDYLKMLESKLP